MAKCPGDSCTKVDATTLDWFCIAQHNFDKEANDWPTEIMTRNGRQWKFFLPNDLPGGESTSRRHRHGRTELMVIVVMGRDWQAPTLFVTNSTLCTTTPDPSKVPLRALNTTRSPLRSSSNPPARPSLPRLAGCPACSVTTITSGTTTSTTMDTTTTWSSGSSPVCPFTPVDTREWRLQPDVRRPKLIWVVGHGSTGVVNGRSVNSGASVGSPAPAGSNPQPAASPAENSSSAPAAESSAAPAPELANAVATGTAPSETAPTESAPAESSAAAARELCLVTTRAVRHRLTISIRFPTHSCAEDLPNEDRQRSGQEEEGRPAGSSSTKVEVRVGQEALRRSWRPRCFCNFGMLTAVVCRVE